MTSKDFAKLIGVSQTAVSRALNNSNLISEDKRLYIIQKAKEYGFVLNAQAKSLRTQRTGTIGILFPRQFEDMCTNMMLTHVYDCIQKEMYNYGYDIMVVYYQSEGEDFSSFERIIRTRKVDGFLILRMELFDHELELIESTQIPCVFMMNADTKVRPNVNYLFSDSEWGGYEAGRYLGRFPEYRQMFVGVQKAREDGDLSLNGYRRGLAEQGVQLCEEDILRCDMSIDSARECIRQNRHLLDGQKVAIFAYNDILSIGIIQACQELGYDIPGQVQILGMSDIPLAQQLRPALSTVHINVEDMVPRCCKLLVDLIDKNDVKVQEWLLPSLVIRETTL